MAPRQSGQRYPADTVKPPPAHGQTALPKRFAQSYPKQVYKPKVREEEVEKMDVDPKRTTSQHLDWTMDIPIGKGGKRPVVINDQVGISAKKDLLLLMIMRPVEVVPTLSTFY
jgi:hypothetical protein